jgi:hypothetical protein
MSTGHRNSAATPLVVSASLARLSKVDDTTYTTPLSTRLGDGVFLLQIRSSE